MRHRLLAASVVAGLLFGAPGAALAIDYRDDTGSGNPGAPTANGTGTASTDYVTLLNSDPAYQSVGTITAVGVFGIGGGVLIRTPGSPNASQYVLTVSHLLGSATPNQVTWTPNGSNDTYTGSAIYLAGGSTDLAIVKLDRPVTEVAPATVYTGSAEVGNVGTVVGVGLGGNGQTGPNSPQGTLLAGQNSIDLKGFATPSGNTIVFTPSNSGPYLFTDFDKPGDASFSTLGSATPLTLEAGITFGDSGGGLFASIGGQTFLVGTTDEAAIVGAQPGFYGDVDYFIDTSLNQDFINSTVPEPTMLSILAVSGGGLLLRRRARRLGTQA